MENSLVSQVTPVIERLDVPVLEAGQYWRDRAVSGPLGVHLVTELKYVQGEVHTVMVESHPSDGKSSRMYFIKDFFAAFDFEPDGERIRQEELATIQEEVIRLQNELLELNQSPARLEELAQAALQTTTGIQPAYIPLPDIAFLDLKKVNEQSVALMHASLDTVAQINRLKTQILMEKVAAISKAIQKTVPFYEELSTRALAQTSETRTYTKRLMDRVASLDVYLGKDVSIERLQSGTSAEYTEPLTVLQRKLAMDEELCLFETVNEYFDASDEALFVHRLQTCPAFVEQIFTRPRAVVLMTFTRRTIEYSENQFENDIKNQKNKSVFLLIRDGDNIFRIWSPVLSHLQAKRLFPSKKEQESFFQKKQFSFDGETCSQKTETIKYENAFFSKCMEWHDEAALHYKRFLLLLAGLDAQKQLFGDFHPAEINFVSVDFQNRYMNFLFDDEGGNSLLENAYTESLEDFFYRHNRQIITGKNGSRIFCDLSRMITLSTAPGAFLKDKNSLYCAEQMQIASPLHNFDIFTVKELDRSEYIDVPMKKIQQKKGLLETKIINCKVFLEYKHFEKCNDEIPPFLHFDGVELEELRYHLNNRGQRFFHLGYIQLFKHIEKELVKRDEYFKEICESLQIIKEDVSKELCKKLFTAWLTDQNFAFLDEKEIAKCVFQIIAQLSLLDDKVSLRGKVLSAIIKQTGQREKDVKLTALSLVGDGTVIAYADIPENEKDNRFEDDSRMTRYILKEKKRCLSVFYKAEVFSPYLNLREVFIENEQPVKAFMDLYLGVEKSFYTPESIRNGTFRVKTELFDTHFADFFNPNIRYTFLQQLLQQQRKSSGALVSPMTAYWPMYLYSKNEVDKIGRIFRQSRILCLTLHNVIYGLCLMEKETKKREAILNVYSSLFKNKVMAKDFLRQQVKTFEEKKSLFTFESIPVWSLQKHLKTEKRSLCHDGKMYPLLCFARDTLVKGEPFSSTGENIYERGAKKRVCAEERNNGTEKELSLYAQLQLCRQTEEANGVIFSEELSASPLVEFLGTIEKLLQ